MRDIDRIIEEYRKSDFEKRLFLFLEYRSLRDRFTDIEMEEKQTELQAKPIPAEKPAGSKMQRLIYVLKHAWST